jgi:hypothetical protein
MALLPRHYAVTLVLHAHWLVTPATPWSFPSSGIPRHDFLMATLAPSALSLLLPNNPIDPLNDNGVSSEPLVLPMKSLPVSGCWAISVILSLDPESPESFTYSAVVDTGSPFLTAPSQATAWTTTPLSKMSTKRKDVSIVTDISNEQYGTTVGSVEWRQAPLVTLVGSNSVVRDQANVALGIPSSQVQQETGGIFLGLMQQDEYRPTFLQQLGHTSFRMDFAKSQLVLLPRSMNPLATTHHSNNPLLSLYDFTPYGPDIHHYGVLCKKITCQLGPTESNPVASKNGKIISLDATSLSRPLVAVFDTGLSGSIFSDTLWEEMQQAIVFSDKKKGKEEGEMVPVGAQVELQSDDVTKTGVMLASNPEFWRFQSFRLPWWYEEEEEMEQEPNEIQEALPKTNPRKWYPHVVVLGSTFWRNDRIQSLDVVASQRRARITILP